jgi:NOL1/NOP2/fmu family ribosome biogenesis protein
MQETLDIWTSKQAKEFLARVREQWGGDWKPEEAFIASPKGKIFLVSRDLAKIDWQKLRISSVGCYVAELRDERVRLSIEGSQLIGPHATKNIIDLDADEFMRWLKGDDIPLGKRAEGLGPGFILVRNNKDYCGSGPLKGNLLLNMVPKARRLPRNA